MYLYTIEINRNNETKNTNHNRLFNRSLFANKNINLNIILIMENHKKYLESKAITRLTKADFDDIKSGREKRREKRKQQRKKIKSWKKHLK